ncbi:Vesicle trafficking between the ER and Golgi [Chytridiales sp. JEL 0842]|nr:Vesicle trafficking between the ER and Golgi [Chytridiales sp. JEL 0842]
MLSLNTSKVTRDASDTDGSKLALVGDGGDLVWKVLIYDQTGQDIISPLMKVNELREAGVTVHMSIKGDRQPIPDVPAVYFVQPSMENIKKISEDLARQLYESVYLNFSYMIPRPLLEELAAATIASDSSKTITQIYDQYLNYVCLEDRLFTLNMPDSYKSINDSRVSDSFIDQVTDNIVISLFSVIATLGVVPIIRCPRGNAAATIASKLDSRLRDHLVNSRNNLFSDSNYSSGLSRPALVILDRNLDLATMLNHAWTYSSLVHDVLDMKLNRVVINSEDKGRKISKTYDIDAGDFFWAKNAGNPFPQVAEDVSTEINQYKKDVEEVTRSSGVTSLDEIDPGANAQNLKTAIEALPALTERKRTLDLHMDMASTLFKLIGERQLDAFFSVEESLGKQSKSAILEILRDPNKHIDDKLRLLLVFYLSVEDIPKEDLTQLEEALLAAGGSASSLSYLKSVKSFLRMAAASTAPPTTSNTANDLFKNISMIGNKLAGHLEGTGVSGGLENILTGVRNLLPTRKDLAITKIVESIMDGTTGTETDDYLQLDPRLGKNNQSRPSAQKTRATFSEAIVFVVGGGNYLEYQNLQDYAQRTQQKRKITYGSTEICTANNFIRQLETLGSI